MSAWQAKCTTTITLPNHYNIPILTTMFFLPSFVADLKKDKLRSRKHDNAKVLESPFKKVKLSPNVNNMHIRKPYWASLPFFAQGKPQIMIVLMMIISYIWLYIEIRTKKYLGIKKSKVKPETTSGSPRCMGGDDANEDDDDDIPRTFTCVGFFLQKEQRKVVAAAERKKNNIHDSSILSPSFWRTI